MSKLLSINVNEHTEKKNGLTYLSWAWAWAEVLKIDPEATWEAVEYPTESNTLTPCVYLPNGTAMVKTVVTINGKARSCMLPVMDHRNKAIQNPDAFAINTAIMRCMTKAISMHGLGLYIYAGEDLPQPSAEDDAAAQAKAAREAELQELALHMIDCHNNGKDLDAIRLWHDPKTFAADNAEANEERLYVWGLLKHESKLRAVIKANRKETEQAAA